MLLPLWLEAVLLLHWLLLLVLFLLLLLLLFYHCIHRKLMLPELFLVRRLYILIPLLLLLPWLEAWLLLNVVVAVAEGGLLLLLLLLPWLERGCCVVCCCDWNVVEAAGNAAAVDVVLATAGLTGLPAAAGFLICSWRRNSASPLPWRHCCRIRYRPGAGPHRLFPKLVQHFNLGKPVVRYGNGCGSTANRRNASSLRGSLEGSQIWVGCHSADSGTPVLRAGRLAPQGGGGSLPLRASNLRIAANLGVRLEVQQF